jgi:Flp pilus assembly protein TadD
MKNKPPLAIKKMEPQRSELTALLEHFQNKQYDEAEKLALALTDKFKTHPFGWKVLGAVFNKTGRLSEGLIACQKSVELAPENAEAYYNLGVTLKELSRLEEAEESYKKAIALKPDFADAYNNLGITLKELDRLAEAEEIYSKGIILKPSSAEALLNRGQLLFDKEEFEAALEDFDLCNTKSSRARSLSCLYALGRIEDIYKRIEAHKEVDGENLRIAAIASFIAKKEQKDTAHNFCKNPLEFIHFSNISTHLEDFNLFIDELIEELHNVKTTWEPYGRAAIKGFVTGKKFNLFASPSGRLAQLKTIIDDEIDIYYSKFN